MTAAELLPRIVDLVGLAGKLLGELRLLLATIGTLRHQQPVVSYENLALRLVLDIQDPHGQRAILDRDQRVRFLTDESGVLRDLVWGEGSALARYSVRGARRLLVRPEGSKRAILLGLPYRPRRGEQARIRTRRVIAQALIGRSEYWEAMVERPTQRLSMKVIFPRTRAPHEAYLVASPDSAGKRLPLRYGADGRPFLSVQLNRPVQDRTYSVQWSW